jgi:alanine dehydrogenase
MSGFLLLSRSDLRALMSFGDYVEAVAEAFRLLAEGRCQSPVPTEIAAQDGTFHIKAGALPNGPGYVAVKINGNFPSNKARHGLPTIQGAVYLADASDGRPLALLDSAEITLQRTGAATAVAARYLARKDSTPRPFAAAVSRATSSSRRCGMFSIFGRRSPGTPMETSPAPSPAA